VIIVDTYLSLELKTVVYYKKKSSIFETS